MHFFPDYGVNITVFGLFGGGIAASWVLIGERFIFLRHGEMAEWSNAAVLKTVVLLREPGVRIPLSPPKASCDLQRSWLLFLERPQSLL